MDGIHATQNDHGLEAAATTGRRGGRRNFSLHFSLLGCSLVGGQAQKEDCFVGFSEPQHRVHNVPNLQLEYWEAKLKEDYAPIEKLLPGGKRLFLCVACLLIILTVRLEGLYYHDCIFRFIKLLP